MSAHYPGIFAPRVQQHIGPCPFCGSDCTTLECDDMEEFHFGRCNACGAEGPNHRNPDEARAAWKGRSSRLQLVDLDTPPPSKGPPYWAGVLILVGSAIVVTLIKAFW